MAEQKWKNLKGCRDYPVLQEFFTDNEMDSYEKQLIEYLEMEETTDIYLSHVPRIICWYEGLIPTVDFISECRETSPQIPIICRTGFDV